ncbi:beta-glucosidase, GBA2 type family protein [Actinidia rufa]|uniref:Beta-glucosidase, GBA2 type family protein n=1 Tax=Actinidia rufa TaxID=165716 RepID=A0A7J0F2M8_9ERIC|nr:beta-glucosidase, GBA2 type family protein [Actinidia rufa]
MEKTLSSLQQPTRVSPGSVIKWSNRARWKLSGMEKTSVTPIWTRHRAPAHRSRDLDLSFLVAVAIAVARCRLRCSSPSPSPSPSPSLIDFSRWRIELLHHLLLHRDVATLVSCLLPKIFTPFWVPFYPRKSGNQGISSWGWNLSGQHSTYHALFPRAWTIYDGEPDPELKISCRQISPFIPHNYRDSSLPTAVFVYTLVNTGKERAKVSLLFTWANSIGGISHLSGDHVNEPFMARLDEPLALASNHMSPRSWATLPRPCSQVGCYWSRQLLLNKVSLSKGKHGASKWCSSILEDMAPWMVLGLSQGYWLASDIRAKVAISWSRSRGAARRSWRTLDVTTHIRDSPRQPHKGTTAMAQKHTFKVTMYQGYVRIYIAQTQVIPLMWEFCGFSHLNGQRLPELEEESSGYLRERKGWQWIVTGLEEDESEQRREVLESSNLSGDEYGDVMGISLSPLEFKGLSWSLDEDIRVLREALGAPQRRSLEGSPCAPWRSLLDGILKYHHGVSLQSWTAKENPPVTFAIAACETQNVNVTVLPCFGLSEGIPVTAKDMWSKMVQDGHFDRENFNTGPSMPSSPGETSCAAVSASTWVEPHGKCTVAFALAWSSPKVKFMKGKSYHRRYTKFYGTSERAALNLVHDALKNYKRWEEEIENWQAPILRDDRLPEWYKFTLFNELYFLVSGGTVWTDSTLPASNGGSIQHQTTTTETNNVKVTEAKVNCKQGVPLSTLQLVFMKALQKRRDSKYSRHPSMPLDAQNDSNDVGGSCTWKRDFAKAVLCEDGRKVKFLAEGNSGIRKVRGAVPHDLGTHDPWHEMNAYNIHDTRDLSFGADVWPSVCAAIEYMDRFDRDNDCLIENDGFPDQTYDTWTVHGVSAYCVVVCGLLHFKPPLQWPFNSVTGPLPDRCKSKFVKAKSVFEAKLWNGSYFNYDSGSSNNSKSIQTDQLAGQWYTASSGLPDLFDDFKIESALQKIYDFNVMKVRGGRMGAVNGMHPNGKVDETCMQSREIWTGVTYAAAATMILAGMEEQAFTTAEGIFIAGWSEEGYGYSFQTPEAWTTDGHFRSLIYMRPLAIWSMQWALSLPKAILEAPKINMMDRILVSPHSARSSHNDIGVRKIAKKAKCFNNSVFHCSC